MAKTIRRQQYTQHSVKTQRRANLAFECINDEVDVNRVNTFNALLYDVVAILILDTLLNMTVQLFHNLHLTATKNIQLHTGILSKQLNISPNCSHLLELWYRLSYVTLNWVDSRHTENPHLSTNISLYLRNETSWQDQLPRNAKKSRMLL